MNTLLDFQKKIGYEFKDESLLMQALTHSSYANEQHKRKGQDNERLEFLGDAVLEIITSEFLYLNYPMMPEGDLTKLRASLVCEPTLAYCTKEISLGEYVRLGKGEERTGGRERKSILSDALEAVIGAIYLDGGMVQAKKFVHAYILTDIDNKKLFHDSKTILQEIVQASGNEILHYQVVKETGPDHAKIFAVEALVGDKVVGFGKGNTKKAAEQEAAYRGLMYYKKTSMK